MIGIRYVAAAALVWVGMGAAQGQQAASTALGTRVAAITSAPGVVRAHWGVAVTAMDGTPIFAMNEGAYFRPASNAKLFTTAAAMHLLGPDTRVMTGATATSLAVDGVLTGDIVLRGEGDGNLSARRIPYESPAERKARQASEHCSTCPLPAPLGPLIEMANAIAASGVKAIHGDIVGDDSLWPLEPFGQNWTIDDAVWGYSAPVSALTVTDNQLELTVAPGAKPGDPATVTLVPGMAYYTVQSSVTTADAKAPSAVRIDRDLGSKVLRLIGTVPMGKPDIEEIAIADPAEYAAMALKTLLEMDGVAVTGVARAKHRLSDDSAGFTAESHVPLPKLPVSAVAKRNLGPGICVDACPTHAEHTSPTLADDVTVTLKVSQNLHAELMLRRLGAAYGSEGSSAQGARVVRQFLLNAGLDGEDFVFYDGSGLSGHDLVTPRATAKLLAYAATQPWFAQWKAALPVGGEDGSLAARFPKAPLKDHVFAKTGTLGESRALSGYVDCASGKTVIFSVMVDTHTPASSADREAMDAIVAEIAAAN